MYLSTIDCFRPRRRKKCRPPCGKQCKYGFELNRRGCSKCKCNRSPCERFQAPLDGYFCGRGINRTDCPSNYTCAIEPNDAYTVCCPSSKTTTTTTTTTTTQPVVTTEKPDSCPTTSSEGGICMVYCDDDSECSNSQKCCGSCPRECIPPIG
ncbi:unnamed protein product [Rotaria magnacalcarata]|uniref:WAP domain-containing protein n=1 Tax=Rotaria magnacalcarata TaxID=392030 RepID=A0A815MJ48_9BILA|nr:unnamed protein product [Rotaria magnacalcarata]CAF5122195.1 unnamed protein product [Rotaria magnacalcarata]